MAAWWWLVALVTGVMWPFCCHSNKTCSQFLLPWQHVSLSVCFHDNKVFMFCTGDAGDQTLERSLTRSPVNFREGRRASDGLMSQGEYIPEGAGSVEGASLESGGWVQGEEGYVSGWVYHRALRVFTLERGGPGNTMTRLVGGGGESVVTTVNI